jgi:hypothetical protein
MNAFVYGAITMGYAIACLFFLRFWRTTRDRLFAIFAASFGILGIHRIVLFASDDPAEAQPLVYAARLAAYVLILFAILDKNRRPSR